MRVAAPDGDRPHEILKTPHELEGRQGRAEIGAGAVQVFAYRVMVASRC